MRSLLLAAAAAMQAHTPARVRALAQPMVGPARAGLSCAVQAGRWALHLLGWADGKRFFVELSFPFVSVVERA